MSAPNPQGYDDHTRGAAGHNPIPPIDDTGRQESSWSDATYQPGSRDSSSTQPSRPDSRTQQHHGSVPGSALLRKSNPNDRPLPGTPDEVGPSSSRGEAGKPKRSNSSLAYESRSGGLSIGAKFKNGVNELRETMSTLSRPPYDDGYANSRSVDQRFGGSRGAPPYETSRHHHDHGRRGGGGGGGAGYQNGGSHASDRKISRDELYGRIAQLESEVKGSHTKVLNLHAQVKEYEDNNARLKRRVDMLQSARDAKEDFIGRQEQDGDIQGQFKALFGQVRTWSNSFATMPQGAPAPSISSMQQQFTDDQLHVIQRVAPTLRSTKDLNAMLADPKKKRKFIRGVVGLCVTEYIFRTPLHKRSKEIGQDNWIPTPARESICQLETEFMEKGRHSLTLATFHEWRALTMSAFDKVYRQPPWDQAVQKYIDDCAAKVTAIVGPLGKADNGEAERKVADHIFSEAMVLTKLLRRQRALWTVRFPPENATPSGHTFLPETMTDVDTANDEEEEEGMQEAFCNKSISIIITPALFKSGNNDGEQYNKEYAVEKAEVSCS